MEEEHKNILRRNRTKLISSISDVPSFLNKLYEELITGALKQQIEAERTPNDKIGKILDILPTKGAQAFDKLYNIFIETDEKEAAYILKPELRPTEQHGGAKTHQEGAGTQDEIELPDVWPLPDAIKAEVKVVQCNQTRVTQYLSRTEVYSMKKSCRGRCFILSNKRFDRPKDSKGFILPERDGAELDVTGLHALFTQLHFKVILHTEKTAQAVKEELSKEADHPDHYDAECFVCVICSHGDAKGIYGVDGGIVPLTEITTFFDGRNCKGLQSKPKLFFIQACQGGEADRPNAADCVTKIVRVLRNLLPEIDVTSVTDSESNTQQGHTKTDMLVACATHPGYVSLRNSHYGTWFIQAVIYVFQNYACTEDIHGLLTLVNRLVAKGKTNQDVLQASQTASSLTKKLYFFPGIYM